MEKIKPSDRLIFALDVQTVDEAVRLVDLLKDHVGVFKIGLELFVASGPGVVAALREKAPGAGIFLDLKFHDIPATVAGAMKSASGLGADFVTVHTGGGRGLLKAAAESSGAVKVLGVTFLTSMSAEDFEDAGIDREKFRSAEDLVLHRARVAREAGCAGVVCSGFEAASVKGELGKGFLVVTPGIRSPGDETGDQKRALTPYQAVRNGADYIVVGRPIRSAPDPVEAAERISEEVERALRERGLSV